MDLPLTPQPWWHILVGKTVDHEIFTAANAILGLCNLDMDTDMDNQQEAHVDFLISSKGFVASCVKNGGSFNDPGSFLWEQMHDAISNPVT